MDLSRRTFLQATAAGAITLYTTTAEGLPRAVATGLPGATLPASSIPQFKNAVVNPQNVYTYKTRWTSHGTADYYEMSIRQVKQQMLPAGMPRTDVWAYGPTGAPDSAFHAPGLTIVARPGSPVQVKWTNELMDAYGNYRPHLFAVDKSLHWANVPQDPAMGMTMTDMKPDLTGLTYVRPEDFADPKTQYTNYTGPVPIVTHLHGAAGVVDHSDGYSEAWYLPAARNIPAGHATHGRWWNFLATKARNQDGAVWGNGYQIATYPNKNRACTLWFHDHALGLTRLNVYSGATSFYITKDLATDAIDSRTGYPAVSPYSPSNYYGLNSPNAGYDLPLAIQDRSFNSDGSLFYPDSREYFDGYTGPYYPQGDQIPPVWVPEFFGNTIIVNGQTWPFQKVEQRRYRLRLLNGCGSRTLYLDFRDFPGIRVHQVANDGGFLNKTVNIMAQPGWRAGRVVLAPAERIVLLVDFTNVPLGRRILKNVGPDAFFPGGRPAENGEAPHVVLMPFDKRDVVFPPADPATTGRVMAFDVVPRVGSDPSTPGQRLCLRPQPSLPAPVRTRRLCSTMSFHTVNEGRYASDTMLGVLSGTPGGVMTIKGTMWGDPVTENPNVGDVEDWEIYNLVQDAPVPHPIHIHETTFQVMERRMIDYNWDTGVMSMGPRVPLLPSETGRKDTIFVYPGEMIRLRMKFTTPGQYMWHCHLLEHEDNEMMRPFRIGPAQVGQPGDMPHRPMGGM